MTPRAIMRGLSRSRASDGGGIRPFRAFRAQHRVQRVEAKRIVAGVEANLSQDSPAKSVANALVTASWSVKRTLSTLYDRRPGGARQTGDMLAGASLGEAGCLAEARPVGVLPNFEEMSAEDIVQYCDEHARHLPAGEDMAMVQRLYDIAFFRHDAEEESSKKALEWVEVLKCEINDRSAHSEESISLFEEDCVYAIDTASRVGRGSLLWQLAEDHVPDNKLAEYITRPEYSSLLDTYLDVTGQKRINEFRAKLIVNVIKHHPIPGVEDPVLVLHALATGGDAAIEALFDTEEVSAFVNVPDDYEAARRVIAKANVSVGGNPLGEIRNPRNLSAIPGIVNSAIIKLNHKDHSNNSLITLQAETSNILRWSLACLRYNIACRLLSQYYGTSTSNALHGLLDKNLQIGIEHMDALEAGLSDAKSTLSINYRLVQEMIEYYCTEGTVVDVNIIRIGAQLICVDRPQCISQLYKTLRSWAY